jgi:GNAT superfamily N-acetyltransferase
LLRGFARLSPQSRYRRFLSWKSQLSDAELVYLTEVDGEHHFAMGAVAEGEAGEEGVAVGRFIRGASDPTVADVGVAVIDDWQHRGLGTLLLLRLVEAARERGITRFSGRVLASNDAIRDVLARMERGVSTRAEGGEIAIEVELPDVPVPAQADEDAARRTPLRRLLALVARHLLTVRQVLGAPPSEVTPSPPSRTPDAARGSR